MGETQTANTKTLVIGDESAWTHRVELHGAQRVDLSSLETVLAADDTPDVVIAPLFSDSFDCFDVGEQLSRVSYSGQLIIMWDELPNPDMIRREMRAQFPALSVDICVSAAQT